MLGICGPQKNDFVRFLFHFSNIVPEFINNFLISTLEDVVCSVGLVGGNEVAIKGSRKWHDSFKLWPKLPDQVWLEDL